MWRPYMNLWVIFTVALVIAATVSLPGAAAPGPAFGGETEGSDLRSIGLETADGSCQTLILHADFNADSAGAPPDTSLPGKPTGDYLVLKQTYGTILVCDSVGTLTDKPVELRHDTIHGEVVVFAYPRSVESCDSMIVSWRSLVRDDGPQFCRCELRGMPFNIIASLEYRNGGQLTYNYPDSALPMSYIPNIAQLFKVTIDFGAQSTSLSVDGAPVDGFQNVPFVQTATTLGRVSLHAQGADLAFDDLEVYSQCCADFRVKGFTLFDGPEAAPGDSIGERLSLWVENIGELTNESSSVGFYLSDDSIITHDDSLLIGGIEGVPEILPDSSAPINIFEGMSIPPGYPEGWAYLGCIVDLHNQVPEDDESNNFQWRPIEIRLKGACSPPSEPANPHPPDTQRGLVRRDADLCWNSCAPAVLSADFNDKDVNYPIGTDGAKDNEPVYVSENISATVREFNYYIPHSGNYTPNQALKIVSPNETGGWVEFEFLNSAIYKSGMLFVQTDFWFYQHGHYYMTIVERGGEHSRVINLYFDPDGRVTLVTPNGILPLEASYGTRRVTSVMFVFHLNQGCFDFWLDGQQWLIQRNTGFTAGGVGRVDFGIYDTRRTFYVDNVHVTYDCNQCRPTEYDVYFGDWPLPLLCDHTQVPACDPGLLPAGELHVWQVIAYRKTSTNEGRHWQFGTEAFDGDDHEVGDQYCTYRSSLKPDACFPDAQYQNWVEDDAYSFSSMLHKSLDWVWDFHEGDRLASSIDWGCSDDVRVDLVDFAYFAGPGGEGGIPFSKQSLDYCFLTWDDCWSRWGDHDLEWIATSAGKACSWDNFFGACFDGLHLMCGFNSVGWGTNYGEHFAERLVKGYRVSSAWYWEVRRSLPWEAWEVAYWADEEKYMGDRIWDAGYVHPDPTTDDWLIWWCPYNKGTGSPKSLAASVDVNTAKVIAVPGPKGPVILVPDRVLAHPSASQDSLPTMNVIQRDVNSTYVESIADGLCDRFGIFCGNTINHNEEEKTFSMNDVSHQLLVYENSGAFEYMDDYLFLMLPDSAPSLMSDVEAADTMESLFLDLGLLPDDAIVDTPSRFEMHLIDKTTGEEIADSSRVLNITPCFSRSVEGYEVVGPGAVLGAAYGDNGRLQMITYGGWRDVSSGGYVRVITLQNALELLATWDGEAALYAIGMLYDTLVVENAELGYYEAYGDTLIPKLDPVWILNGFLVFDNDTTSYQQLLIPAYDPCHGDINGDEQVDLDDVLYLLNYLFGGGPPPVPIIPYGDVNSDGIVSISDAVHMINHLLKGQPPPGR